MVVHRTGLKPDLLRAWERRYGAVRPARTESNRRLYSEADIDRLRLLARITELGRPIHQAAQLTNLQLESLLLLEEELEEISDQHPPRTDARAFDNSLIACLAAVRAFDERTLRLEFERSIETFGRQAAMEELMTPLLYQVGDLWHRGKLRPAEEHLATSTIRSFLGHLPGSPNGSEAQPWIVVTTPGGQLHEIGALMVATTAAGDGWNVAYLGPNLPPEEIANAARERGARAVAISLVYPADDPTLGEAIATLGRYLGEDVALLVGGRAAPAYGEFVEAAGGALQTSLSALREQLSKLRARTFGPTVTGG